MSEADDTSVNTTSPEHRRIRSGGCVRVRDEEFVVANKENTTNVAYLSTPLQMHTDLPYYDYKPGCNLLHCLVQSTSTGGQNLIADAFWVADHMRREHPEDFRLLSETLVNWTDVGVDEGGEFHSIYRAPVICLDREGKLERINHSVPQRDSFFNVPLDKVEPWYRAMARFVQLLHQEAVEFKTMPGDILTFSNIRMVHGRTGYTDTEGNMRHIVGAYLDWDEIYSRLRVEEFVVANKENTTNVAYLSTPLQMHTDLPYYDYKPGCNLLHCLVQSTSTGGQNLIADAFWVADHMRREHPEDFRLLSETLVNWTDVGVDEGGEFHSIYRAPVICLDREGKLERINHSVPQRDSFFNVPLDKVEPWYRAMARFVQLLHQEAVEFKTMPGDILTFSNIRMVHGRTGYTDTEGNMRHIVGAYLDWDEIYSRLRVLKGKKLE
ncbi:gamma-butyrobetaine dioxygenase [Culex quinquefasciatus]|uniref:Gamma-butyrobetaine dioxygenase n=1 Tax=Culex quinquefasciatus TaxID=7176 RepID=B0XCW0_CULQU|nr:gamma-butyrobetaine dioxygenase [Culex quinquefasciatus]|eukprot:XP_001867482.1 gamma-butyrobetaine dioxygenase [Culex quinquefasciatus]